MKPDLYKEFSDRLNVEHTNLFSYCYKLCSHYQDAEDLLADGILKAIPAYDESKAEYFDRWMKVIIKNHFINQYRKKIKFKKVPIENLQFKAPSIDHFHDEDLLLIQQHLSSVEFFILNEYGKGFLTREIAEIMDMNHSTVKVKMFKARKKIERLKKQML